MARDFYDFTYNGVRLYKDLGVLRTSDGSRYNEDLHPEFDDRTTTLAGHDGTYYFGTNYTNRQFSLSLAYDNLSEKNFMKLRTLFGDGEIHELTFDEEPYKLYQAKLASPMQLQYICFDKLDDTGGRVYKGEGNINLVCYNPFAKSRYKWKENYKTSNIPEWEDTQSNLHEWLPASGIISQSRSDGKKYDTFYEDTSGSTGYDGFFYVYNPGDKPTDFKVILQFNSDKVIGAGALNLDDKAITWKSITAKSSGTVVDSYVQINSKNHLIEGLNGSKELTGNIYNEYILGGDFFNIPIIRDNKDKKLLLDGARYNNPTVEYNYLYF